MKTKKIVLAVAYAIFSATLCITCNVACTANPSSSSSKVETPQYNFYDFDESDVYKWIHRALDKKDCTLVKITSTAQEYNWLVIHADVKEYDLRGRYLRDNKAEIRLHMEPHVGLIDEGTCYLEIK